MPHTISQSCSTSELSRQGRWPHDAVPPLMTPNVRVERPFSNALLGHTLFKFGDGIRSLTEKRIKYLIQRDVFGQLVIEEGAIFVK